MSLPAQSGFTGSMRPGDTGARSGPRAATGAVADPAAAACGSGAGGGRFLLARALGSAAAGLSRASGAGRGTTIGGRVMLAVDPAALRHAASGRSVVLVSGTNGKSTTRALLTAALRTGGPVASNELGANMPGGLTAALCADRAAPRAVLEVDEPYLPAVARATRPSAVVLLNLSRDQLDRYAEVRRLADTWRAALRSPAAPLVVANADDPLVVWAAGAADRVCWVAAGQRWHSDATVCPGCGDLVRFLDDGWCCGCGLRRPRPAWWWESDRLATAEARWPLRLRLPGRVNRGNAAMAAAAAASCGIPVDSAAAAMGDVGSVDGRYAVYRCAGRSVRLLLAKNPAGWSEALGMVRPYPASVVVAVNARTADGRDPAWLWDVPFERLRGRRVVAAGERCADVAVRLRYAGVEHVQRSHWSDAVAALPPLGEVEAMANYTAFQTLRSAVGGG